MKKKKKLFRWVGLGFLILLFASQAGAVLTVNFPESINVSDKERIQYYWNGDATTPNVAGRTINSDPTITLNLSDTDRQAKVDSSPTTQKIHFGCEDDDRYRGSNYIYIRLWDNSSRNNYYTDLRGFSNTALGTVISDFGGITYLYVKDTPSKPIINQYDETATSVLSPTPSSSRRVTFSSIQSARSDGKEVEIPQSIWNITYNGTPLPDRTVSGRSLTLSTPSDTLNPGDTYVVKVKHKNYWGDVSGDWSDPVTYVVGAGGGVASVRYSFVSTGLGLNQFALPFAAKHGDVNIDNVRQLVERLNVAAGSNAVTSIGWWDEVNQIDKGYVITYPGGTLTFSAVNGANADPASENIVTGRSYQVVVNRGFSITFTSR